MCSIDDDDDAGAKYMKQQPAILITDDTQCVKCKNKATITLRKKDYYCDNCFIISTIHKFRATFGKSKLIKPNTNVLIAYSGDINSSLLLHLVKHGLEENVYKKLKFNPIITYVEDGLIYKLEDDKRCNLTTEIINHLKIYNLPIYVSSLSEIMQQNDVDIIPRLDLIINKDMDSSFLKLLKSVRNQTAEEELIRKLKRSILIKLARKLNCSYILYADTSTKLAVNSLVNISLGGVSHIASDIGFTDERDKIIILRPMRDLTSEEVDTFSKIKNISAITDYSSIKYGNPFTSINSRISHFINDLQTNFPATVSTVLRTSNKLENSTQNDEDEICILCQSFLDNEIQYSALQSTEFSKNMSTFVQNFQENCRTNENDDQTCSNCCCSKDKTFFPEIEPCFCYSCKLIIKNLKDINDLPEELLLKAKVKHNKSKMKSIISNFLL